MTDEREYSPGEMMVVSAARLLEDGDRVLVGIGLPNLAANLAKRLHAPNLVLFYEAGVVDAAPARLPLSIGDPCLVTGAVSVCSMFDLFYLYLQRGLVDVGFLGAAQVDRYGNINSTVIGEYERPKVRLGGSGGACDIALSCRKTLILLPHAKRRFPEKVDFITSPGYLGGRSEREALGFRGGPEAVVTDLGLLKFDENGEMFLYALNPKATVEQILENTGWNLKVADDVKVLDPPTDEELRILREELDPNRVYLGRLD
ncbi:MAG TPA: CoA-transferase subunit beta [Clostridia bacterium]|nr:CoA-transferase subunit beta [Clostridia bacterium]